MTTNISVRDVDITVPNAQDSRRLEVVADGLPLFGGAQLNTTLVCLLLCEGSQHSGAAERDGVALVAARRKERTFPELMAPRSRARQVVLATSEALIFLRFLAEAKASHEPHLMRCRAGLADAMVFSPGMCRSSCVRHVGSWAQGLRGAPMALCLRRTRWRVTTLSV